jgi:TolB protein
MPPMRRWSALVAIVATGATPVAVAVATAGSAKPARNGEITFRRFFDLKRTTGAVFVVSPDGTGVRQVTHPPNRGVDDQPNWSPDGSRILFTRQPREDPDGHRAFWTVKPDGTDSQLLSPGCLDGPTPCLPNEQKSQPTYSPDGKQIAYGWAGGNVRDDIGQIEFSELYLMNADGSNPHPLTSFTKDAPYSGDTGPGSWSPDGKQIVLTHFESPVGHPANTLALYIINADGTGLRRLTRPSLRAASRADWSSDGRRIVFHTVPKGDVPGGDIYTIRPDGSGLRRLTHFRPRRMLGELAFSPDAKRIVFTKGGDNRDMFVMRANGTGIRQITRTKVSVNWPDWGPK